MSILFFSNDLKSTRAIIIMADANATFGQEE